jgi:hypothetical protein
VLDTLKIVPFLFLTYLLMEFIEHKASDKLYGFMKSSGGVGPLAGGLLGTVPQCGFSSVAANLFSCRVITIGTLVAVFLSTSDEMLPILIGGAFEAKTIITILAYKVAVSILIGFIIDLAMKLMRRDRGEIDIDELCENDNCHCERGILYSALHHTVSITLFIFIVTIIINTAVFFIGEDNLSALMYNKPVISHLIAAVFGLIPNCAASVALTTFYTEGLITMGTMLSGLFAGAGVGLLVLLKVNKNRRENLVIIGILILAGFLAGLLADLTGLSALIG